MKRFVGFLILCLFVLQNASCNKSISKSKADFIIAFGSCNKQYLKNELWDDIVDQNPDVWIWGGDIVYADTENMDALRADYNVLLQDEGYKKLISNAKILGTWDDHDYGINDGGEHFEAKTQSQQVFLDFFNVPKSDSRRQQEGVYYAETMASKSGSVKIILLDTRYFRSDLTRSEDAANRYQPNGYGEGKLLGAAQWEWLEQELQNSKADFNVIVSSIQVLSNKHGFEEWGNFPHEVDRLKRTIIESKANGVILLSGDRHLSEFSKENLQGLSYPLIDFTSSGLTHVYEDFRGEPNPYRIGKVVPKKSFGVLEFDFETKKVNLKMMGDKGEVFQQITEQY